MGTIAFGDVQNWEELNDLIASLQVWVGQQEGAGRWTDVPYSTALFGSSAGTWTVQAGDMRVYQYTVNQDLMRLRFHVVDSTTASMGNQLFVRLPDGWRCRDNQFLGLCYWADGTGGGTYGNGVVLGTQDSGGKRLNIVRDVLPTSTNWPNATDLFNLGFSLTIPVIRE